MRKRKYLVFPLLIVTSLVSCNQIDSQHSLVSLTNYANTYNNLAKDEDYYDTIYSLTPLRLHELLDNKESFPLYIYGEYCSHCINFKPILGKYIRNTGRQFYKITFESEEDYLFVKNDYPEVFSGYEGTPAMLLIKDGELTYQVSNSKFGSYNAFATIINKHFYSTNLYCANNLNTVKTFINDNKNCLIYSYDDASLISIDLYKTIYKAFTKKCDKNILIINKNDLSEDNYLEIASYFGFDYTDKFACIYENGEENKTADYTINSGSNFQSFLTNYLQ